MKNKNYHTVGTFPKTNRKEAKSIPPTHIYITAHFLFNKIGDFKLVLWVQTAPLNEMMQSMSYKCLTHVRKMPTPAYNQTELYNFEHNA